MTETESIRIKGPAGWLEGECTRPEGAEAVAVLSHPHPQYGGSMHDGVLATAEAAVLAVGIASLRYNFRGVGGSEGQYDNARGEADDLRAALAWCQEQSLPVAVLLGYSFGAGITANVAADVPQARCVLIAPPAVMLSDRSLPADTQIIAGQADTIAAPGDITAVVGSVQLHTIPGADHFFSGCHDILAQSVEQAINGA